MSNQTESEPCPFCGSDAEWNTRQQPNNSDALEAFEEVLSLLSANQYGIANFAIDKVYKTLKGK